MVSLRLTVDPEKVNEKQHEEDREVIMKEPLTKTTELSQILLDLHRYDLIISFTWPDEAGF